MLNLVFVHLGDAKADHLLPNIQRLRKLFPQYPVHLVISNQALATDAVKIGIPITLYAPSERQHQILQDLNHDTNFRQGFWRFTIERLFALELIHRKFPNDGLLHIESDVLILNQFPFAELENQEKLIWSEYNLTHDVSALLFSPNLEVSQWLVAEIEKELNENHLLTDMTVLSKIRRSNPTKVTTFPRIDEAFHGKLDNAYDSAAIGMWLCGQDPRNHYGILKLHKNEEFLQGSIDFDPSFFEYTYSPILGLQLRTDVQLVTLKCLHVHSKDLRLFSETWERALIHFVALSRKKEVQSTFLFREFLNLVKSNARQRTLLPFLAGIPFIYRARMSLRKVRQSAIVPRI